MNERSYVVHAVSVGDPHSFGWVVRVVVFGDLTKGGGEKRGRRGGERRQGVSVKHTNDVWNGEYEGVWRERSKSCIRYYGCRTPEERREKCEVLYARMRGRVYVIAARDRRVVYGTARRDQREVKCCMRGEYVIAATGQRGWLHYRRGSATLTVLPFYRRPTVSSDYPCLLPSPLACSCGSPGSFLLYH